MSKVVNKFGGEIMGSLELNKLILKNIKQQKSEGINIFIVCSALSQITNKLLNIIADLNEKKSINIKDFINELYEIHVSHAKKIYTNKESLEKLILVLNEDLDLLENSLKFIANFGHVDFVSDKIVSFGEKLSTHFLKILLEENSIPTTRFTGEELGILTDSNYNDANIINKEAESSVLKNLNNVGNVVLIAGFTGIDSVGRTTTLGRGGTDTTACFIGNVIDADRVILWKNINGVLTSDPRIVQDTKTIDCLNYDEAEESGKVVCSKAIEYLRKKDIQMEVVFIKDSNKKTIVSGTANQHTHIKLISYVKDCSLLTIKSVEMTKQGFLHKIASLFHEFEVNMSFIRNTRDSMYISIENNQKNVLELFERLKSISNLSIDECSIINIIGKLDWEIAMDVNRHLNKISNKSKIGVFPHEDCSRLEAIVNNDELDEILNDFHSKFILNT